MLLLFMKEMSFPAKRSMQNKLFQSNFDCLHIYIWLNLISFLRPNEHIMWMICNLIEFNTIFISKTALLKFQICKILAWVGLLSGAQVTQWLWQQTSELGNVDKGSHPSPSYPIETREKCRIQVWVDLQSGSLFAHLLQQWTSEQGNVG